MHRIATPDAVANLFNDNPSVQSPTTRVTAAWLNDVQENLARAIEAFGIALSAGDFDQLKEALAGVGLPSAASIDNLNTLARSGFFSTTAAATGRPAGEDGGWLFSTHDGDEDGAQIFVPADGGALQSRACVEGVWSAWSGGAWETGTNAYGSWEKTPTGIIRQWGYVAGPFGETGVTVTFPLAFPTACEDFSATPTNDGPSISQLTVIDIVPPMFAVSALVLVNRESSGSPNIPGFYWRATGR